MLHEQGWTDKWADTQKDKGDSLIGALINNINLAHGHHFTNKTFHKYYF